MAITPPRLDDRRFDDLVEDLLARIPAHTPEWTNPRLGDPGRTMVELFAWLGDALLYRANLVPERQRLVFQQLLGAPMRGALPARGIVQLAYAQPPNDLTVQTLQPGATLSGPAPFETLSETSVLPIVAEAYIKRALDDGERARMADVVAGLARIHRVNGAAEPYETHRVFDADRAEPDGIDVFASSIDRVLWIALLAPTAARPTEQESTNESVRNALGGAAGTPTLLSLGVVPTISTPELFDELEAPAPLPVLWELATRGTGTFGTEYLTLDPLPDSNTTAGLTRAGTLRLPLPGKDRLWVPPNDVLANPSAGVGDTPPRIDDADRAARLVGWLRLRPRPGAQVEHLALSWIGANAVEVDQRTTLRGSVLGSSTGAADQSFSLPQGSVDADTLVIEVEEPGQGYRTWSRIEDLATIDANPNVAREAAVFEFDAAAGTLRFGDGIRGRIPERQMRVRLAFGRFGGGVVANLPPQSLTAISATRIEGGRSSPLKVQQPLPMQGGVDAETMAQAEARIPALLRHRDRAVTPLDYQRLAFEVPGIAMGRVEVMPRFKPRDRRFEVPGVVSVMVLPEQPMTTAQAPNPRPDRPFLERTYSHLAARSPLASELYVIGCEYIPLGLAVGVVLRDGFGRDAVLLEVRQALKRLLWPLPPGGADGKGWTLGRHVRERELEVEVSRVAGVREVSGLNLFGKGVSESGPAWTLLPRNQPDGTRSLELARWQLPELLGVIVVDGDTAVPTSLAALPNPFAKANQVAVPVVPELC
ncbi:putative baseplate assembly protein [Variovorax sp. dw_308]|uniref:putative baseplate assembly protein n=1 Tax=Variovorax sp. dw_308 TaxID=2721546 RepID=UPI001C4679BD|nr:putative baseplate assembly protein [Variovorax sp. dw_308]